MSVYALNHQYPQIDTSAWVAESAQVIGDVWLAAHSSVWFGAVLRGDNALITVGQGSNIQDACVLHTDEGLPLSIGRMVTVGHGAVLHGCTLEDETLIGMGARVLNGARIARYSVVAAGALVTEGKSFPEGVLIMGQPARAARALSAAQIDALRLSAQHYIRAADRYRSGLQRLT